MIEEDEEDEDVVMMGDGDNILEINLWTNQGHVMNRAVRSAQLNSSSGNKSWAVPAVPWPPIGKPASLSMIPIKLFTAYHKDD